MKRMLLTQQFRLLCAIGVLALAQPPGHGAIGGVVIDSASGDPVRKAVVTLTWHGTPRSWATLRTSGDGTFRFEGLPAGSYDLRATKTEIGTAVYGADQPGETGDAIVLRAGETRDGLKLRFLHTASFSGRVLDPDGDPVRNVTVTMLRPSRNLGERIAVHYKNAQTNDRGEYRIVDIQPGTYYASVSVPWLVRPAQGALTMLTGEFYGGAGDWKDSPPFTIHGGETVSGIDFQLAAVPVIKLRGRVTGLPDPSKPAGTITPLSRPALINGGSPAQIQFVRLDPTGLSTTFGTGLNNPDGHFESPELPAGRYRVDATAQIDGKTFFATQTMDAQPGVGDIALTLAPAGDINGRIRIEGDVAKQQDRLTVAFTNDTPSHGNRAAQVADDGSFTIKQVPPGEWGLNINPMPPGSYLKSAMLGDKDVRYAKVPIEAGADASLAIVISMHTANISGQVDAAGGDAERAGILLAPVGKFHDLARFYYAVTADDDGKFKMLGIAPGKYKMYALEKLAALNFRSPEAADALDALIEGGAPVIDLGEDANAEAHPKLIPTGRARTAVP